MTRPPPGRCHSVGESRRHLMPVGLTAPARGLSVDQTKRSFGFEPRDLPERSWVMGRAYNVIDADGHVLEPLDLWGKYIDPGFRDRAPRLFIDADGKERLRIDGRTFGGRRGLGTLGAIGARDGVVCDDTMTYKEGKKG